MDQGLNQFLVHTLYPQFVSFNQLQHFMYAFLSLMLTEIELDNLIGESNKKRQYLETAHNTYCK